MTQLLAVALPGETQRSEVQRALKSSSALNSFIAFKLWLEDYLRQGDGAEDGEEVIQSMAGRVLDAVVPYLEATRGSVEDNAAVLLIAATVAAATIDAMEGIYP